MDTLQTHKHSPLHLYECTRDSAPLKAIKVGVSLTLNPTPSQHWVPGLLWPGRWQFLDAVSLQQIEVLLSYLWPEKPSKKNVAGGGESRSPSVSFLTRTSWKMKASTTQAILCLPIHFLAPKEKKNSCFLPCRPNMAKHQGNSEWNQLHLLLTEFSFILILPRAGYSAASNYNEELLSNGFQIAPRWGINWKGQFKSLGHVNAFLILSDWEISGCKRLKCSELIKT